MRIFIQARKDGYNVLFPTPTPTEFYQFASDIQSASANNDAIYYGKNFYTLAFASDGCIFTKYVIGYDIQRNNLGNVGISVFIPNTKKLSGNDVKMLLDDLLNKYCTNYCPDNNISDKREDWSLFTSIANSYDAKLLSRSSDYNNVTTGAQDPAYHYYKPGSELIEHLEKPFQEEYSDYKQILFIDGNLQGSANPLNVLKNSGVEVNPDLNNEYFYLSNYNSSKGIKVTANDKLRSDKRGENQIRAKWKVEIKYSKDDRCYKPINAPGTISDLSSEIHKYLEIRGNQILLNYDAFNNPEALIKPIAFEIKNRQGNVISGAKITCENNNYPPEKTVTNNRIIFSGEEIKERWSAIARKDDSLGKKEFTPEKTNESVEIIVEKRKIIPINVKDENGKNLSDFEVWTNHTNSYQRSNTIEFVDEQIIDSYTVTIRKEGFEDKNINDFQPQKQNSIDVTLKEKQKTTQTHWGQHWHNHKPEKQKSFAAEAKIFFSKPAVIVGSVGSMLVLGVCIWALFFFLGNEKQPKETPLTTEQITSYVEGNSLILNTLNDYKENWKKQDQDFNTKPWWRRLFGGKEKAESAEWKSDWQTAYESIEQAITKRKEIDAKKFEALRNQQYSKRQSSFKTAIEKIDSTKYAEVGQKLGDVSALTLTQIAGKINEILKPNEPAEEETPQEPKGEENKPKQSKEQPKPQKRETAIPPTQQKTVSTDKTSEIIQYIKGSELREETLNQYLKHAGKTATLKTSINLCLKLWALDGKTNNSYSSYKVELNNDINLKNSKLKDFVDEMCNKERPKYIKELPAIDQRKALSHIKSRVQ